MQFKNILLLVLVILIIYILYRWYQSDTNTQLTATNDAKVKTVVDISSTLNAALSGTATVNQAYSLWLYIDSWDYEYGTEKIVLQRGNVPIISLGAMQNDLLCRIPVYTDTTDTTTTSASNTQLFTCTVTNIPIQRWVNVIVSVYGRTVDVYVSGKLVKTCVTPTNVAPITDTTLQLSPSGGFSGYTKLLQFFVRPLNPQDAWNIYSKNSTSWFSNLLGSYSVKVSLINNTSNTASSSIVI